MSKIQFLKAEQIDRLRWDACVAADPQAEIYGFSWWLDAVAPDWGAWVMGDYELALPLPIKRRLGLSYLVRPPHTPHLALYGPLADQTQARQELWQAMNHRYNYIRMAYRETSEDVRHIFNTSLQARQVLDLREDYASLSARFHSSVSKNLRRAELAHLTCDKDHATSAELLHQLWQSLGYHDPQFYDSFAQLLQAAKQRDMLQRYVARDPKGVLASEVYFFKGPSRVHLFVAINPACRTQGAGYLAMDTFIRDHAQQPLILDFGGSSIEGVAQFNKTWGALDAPLTYVHKTHGIWRLLTCLR